MPSPYFIAGTVATVASAIIGGYVGGVFDKQIAVKIQKAKAKKEKARQAKSK